MSNLLDIQRQAEELSAEDREGLLAFLVRGLEKPPSGPSDDEVLEREREMDAGETATVSFDEFVSQARQS